MFLRRRRKTKKPEYDLWRLVDNRWVVPDEQRGTRAHLICDIDKTYLETEFESLVKMARIAFETAEDKRTVPGAADVLVAARWHAPQSAPREGEDAEPRGLHFVSSSPPQLRKVLEQKLLLDFVDWSSDTFKDQVYNLRMGRFDLLKQQVAYKSAAILRLVQQCHPAASFTMIGDNAEWDGFIYLGIKLACEKRLSEKGYGHYLRLAAVEESVIDDLYRRLEALPAGQVAGILIRDLSEYDLPRCPPLTDPIITFTTFFEVALWLGAQGLMAPEHLWPLTLRFRNEHDQPCQLLGDCLARTFAGPAAEPFAEAVTEVRERLRPWMREPVAPQQSAPSLEGFEALSEDDILALASDWAGRIRRRGTPEDDSLDV